MSLQNLQQERVMSLMIKIGQIMVKKMELMKSINLTKVKSSLSDYSYAYIFVTGDITTTGGNAYSNVAFRNCAPFTRCVTHINDEHIDTADNLNITMPI